MLIINVDSGELFDNVKQEFINTQPRILQLEHSLISISKWEAKWHLVFLSKAPKTKLQAIDYVKCMTINNNVDPNVYLALNDQNLLDINRYIEDPMSATCFPPIKSKPGPSEPMTSELIYYWMTSFGIDWSAEKWHLNRLLNLIRIAQMKNSPKGKQNKKDILSANAALNAERRAKWGTNG